MIRSTSMKPQKKSKPPPLVLCSSEAHYWPLPSPLAEFAAIATSPESPLVKEMSCDNMSSVSNAFKLPSIEHVTPSTDPCTSDLSSCSETPLLTTPCSSFWERFNQDLSSQTDTNCASIKYTSLQVDDRSMETTKTSTLFRPHNMKDIKRELSNVDDNNSSTSFNNQSPWSKYYTHENLSRLGIPCRELLLGDVCIPLCNTKETTPQNEHFAGKTQDTKPSVLFDLDSAAQALSNMAKRKEQHVEYKRKLESTLKIVKNKGTRVRKRKTSNSSARRPMNAFMLFAKRFRLEITRKHPGKDNRAISVILGDEWKSLSSEDRKVYILEAKSLAEEHKRIYPDCWKRKRTTQVSSRGNRKH
ncbi:HMG box-containing protein 1-like [Dendronephthya gigantea]|uniref:HMG box-containing protein 1-like n=1 Tax=Dendronephthya gigantea TaxID=151771 RepID=UPI00106CD0F2|nr:HMG box-containing protein 1-like [Dendronephthya gigantea]